MKSILSNLLIFLSILFVVACTDEMAAEGGEGNVSLRIVMPGQEDRPVTRAAVSSSDKENVVEKLTLLFKSDKGELGPFYYTTNNLKFTYNVDGTPVANLSLNIPFDKIGTNPTVFAYANQADAVPSGLQEEGTLWNGNDLKPLVMSGQVFLDDNLQGTLQLVRHVAKLRVRVEKVPDCIPADLEIAATGCKVQILKIANTYAFYETKDISGTSGFGYIDYPEHAGSTLRYEKDEMGQYVIGGVIDSAYIYENYLDDPAGYNDTNTTQVKISVPVIDPVSGTTSTQEATFSLKTADGGYRLLRNTIYTLTAQVRSLNSPMQLKLGVMPDWDDVLVDGSSSGTYLYLLTDLDPVTNALVLDSAAGGTLTFETDATDISVDADEINLSDALSPFLEVVLDAENKNVRVNWKDGASGPVNVDQYIYLTAGSITRKIRIYYLRQNI